MEENVDGRIRVLLADDHTLFRQGLASVLASHGAMEIVAEVPNDAEVLNLARELRPDVVVMQVQVPFQRSKATLETLRAFEDPPRVVICTMFENPRYVREFKGIGASAYVLKSSSAEHLVATIRAAVLDPQGGDVVVGMPASMLQSATEGADGVLSGRELEVLLLASRGLSNRRIASSLDISEATVKRHMATIHSKMQVGSRVEAAREALTRNWITIEEMTRPESWDGESADNS